MAINLFEGYGPDNPLIMSGAGLCKYLTTEAIKAFTDAVDFAVGGSITPGDLRAGNPGVAHEYYDNPLYSVNAWGMNCDGSNEVAADKDYVAAELRAKVILSVAGFKVQDYVDLYSQLCDWGAGIELNFGCPNVRDDGIQEPIASFNPDYMDEILRALSVLAGEHPNNRWGEAFTLYRSWPVGCSSWLCGLCGGYQHHTQLQGVHLRAQTGHSDWS